MKALLEIIASNPPSIAIALAGILALTGDVQEATTFLSAGIIMQILWILGKYVITK